MTKFIILSGADVWNLSNNKPVKLYVDQIPYVICTDEYYKDMRDKNTDRRDGQNESNEDEKVIHELATVVLINNRLKDLSERVENIEKQIKEEKEEQLKKLEAELDYAKFRCALPTIMDMMSHRNED